MEPTHNDLRRVQAVAANLKTTFQQPTKGAWLFTQDGTILLWYPASGVVRTAGLDGWGKGLLGSFCQSIDDLIVLICERFGPEEEPKGNEVTAERWQFPDEPPTENPCPDIAKACDEMQAAYRHRNFLATKEVVLAFLDGHFRPNK